MKRNCVIIIDCWDNFPRADKVISYMMRYKPMFVVNASYHIGFWAPAQGKTVIVKDTGQAHGLFDFLGDLTLPFNSQIKKHLNKNNIPLIDITSSEEFIEFATLKKISSITVMGSSWRNCLHNRPLGINYLPRLLPEKVRYLTYPMGCMPRADEDQVTQQIETDSDWIELPNTDRQIWEFVRDRQIVLKDNSTVFVKDSRKQEPVNTNIISRREKPPIEIDIPARTRI